MDDAVKLKFKPTLTIGIPAYNEAKNIAFLLESIFEQKVDKIILEKVIVVCDGSTDGTERKVLEFSKRFSIVQVIFDDKRMGKTTRLNQLYQMNASDFILTLDGDVVLGRNTDIEEMIKQFDSEQILVVAGHQEPIKPESFVAKIIYTNHVLWNETRIPINNGDHIANLYGAASMTRGSFAKSLKYPAFITCDEEYLYIMAKKKNGFKYAKNVCIFYRTATTLEELHWQGTRFLNERRDLVAYFGKSILDLHNIPIKYKICAIIKMMTCSPLYTPLAIILNLWLRAFPKTDKLNRKGMWGTIETTKKGIDRKEIEKNNLN